ncbi:MAG: hypothetical protein K2X27_00055 [Candidatus Obscuribacterales bacterium]|nr:hypothetical protein [Candidatus Obscuribacterales bacterium]
MGKKIDSFYTEMLADELKHAVSNDFGKAVMRLPNQGLGEVREEVFVYFSAMAMQQINAIAAKYGIEDTQALNELYQASRANFIQGFRIGQSMGAKWGAS